MAEDATKTGKGEEDQGSNLRSETFLEFVNQIIEQQAAVDVEKDKLKTLRKKAKAEGIVLGDLDAVVRMSEWGRNEVREHFANRQRYAAWLGLPTGTQGDFFKPVDTSDPKVAASEWEQKGVTAGLLGKDATAPEECPGEHVQAFLKGHATGQKRLAEASPKFNAKPKDKGKAQAPETEPA